MDDENRITPEPKNKKRGWPKGKPRGVKAAVLPPTWSAADPAAPGAPKSKSWTLGGEPNWDTNQGAENPQDRLHIPPDRIPDGMSLQWVTHTVYGQEMTQHRLSFERMGWTPVDPLGGDGRFDGQYMPKGHKGEINVDGLVLMMRPKELTDKARRIEHTEARERMAIKEAQLRGGDIGIPGADHPSALRTNKVNRSIEQITIPKGRDEK